MATSGYSDAWVTSWDTLRFNWWQIEQSIADNYTKIGWSIELISGSSGAIYSTAAKSWNATVNGAYYEGTNTVNIGNNTNKYLASGETIIYHDTDGSKQFSYSFNQYFGITFSGSWIGTVSGSGSAWLEPIPRQATIRSAPDFTDKDSPTIWFDNPAGSAVTVQVCISWTGAPDIAYRTVDPGATSYTFNFTEAELNSLYAATLNGSNSRYVTFHVTTIIGSNVYYSPLQRLFTVTDCLPELNPTVEDLGGSSVPVTGDSSILLRYFNYPKATFNATAKKGASIVSRTVTCGSQTLKAEGDYAQFNNVDSGTFIFTIKDNRGNEVSKPVTLTMIDYITLSCGTIIDKDLNPDNTANITLNITGDYYEGSLGFYDNDLTVEYRYKSNTTDYPLDTDGNEIWTTVEATVSNGKYEAVATIENIDYKGTYTIQTRAKDMLYTWGVAAKDEIVKIVPVFDWGENDFNFNVPVTIQGKEARTYGTDRIARAYTQKEVSYQGYSYIKLYRDDSPTDLYNQDIATFNDDGTITINKDMIALVNVHILSYNNNDNNRSWIRLWNYDAGWQYTASINYGMWSTSDINTVLNFTAGARIGVQAAESMIINSGGPSGSYIEIIEL